VRAIGIVMAMQAEARPLIHSLGAAEVDPPAGGAGLPPRWYTARRGECEVVIAVNGVDPQHGVDAIGTQPAILSTVLLCRGWALDLVVSAGTAGGWGRCGGAIADVYLSRDRFVYHDRRIDLPGFAGYSVGSFPAVPASALAAALGCKEAIVTTGNSLDETDHDRQRILAAGAAVKDMEAAAVADVARLVGVPMLAVKAITDLVDAHAATDEQFLANLGRATARLRDVMVGVIDWCADRTVAQLGGEA
jgi:nucleoside phosphorylase